MSWTLTKSVLLGPAYAGLTDLRAQLYDTTGVASGAAISTGFTTDLATGRGQYGWSYPSMTDGFRGFVKFYSNATGAASAVTVSITAEDEISVSGGNVEAVPADVDGLTWTQQQKLLMAIAGGVAVPDGDTVTFFGRDGTTPIVTITYGADPGQRTVSTLE